MMRVSLIVVAVALVLGLRTPSAPAEPAAFAPCGEPARIVCARITVPLDRSGAIPGAVGIFVTKRPASSGTSRGALLYLVGGPGDSGTAQTASIAEAYATYLRTRDLYVIDYRGVGRSGPLSCRSEPDWRRCSAELGPRRHLYTTREIVEDIEDVREELGLDRMAIFGVSYGAKIAQGYALRYGNRVERLVLDSLVPVNGWDALDVSSFRSVGRVLRDICAGGACRGITRNPTADLAALAAAMKKKPLAVTYLEPNGSLSRTTFEASVLPSAFWGGNVVFDPVTRARWPSAIRSALEGDLYPLGRLRFVWKELSPAAAGQPPSFNRVVWHATKCEDMNAPWRGATGSAARSKRVQDAARRVPARALYPLNRHLVPFAPDVLHCIEWQESADHPVITPGSRFKGPTLILSGAHDTRTPLEDARAAVKLFPGSTLIVVPDTGHAPASDPRASACARSAVDDLLAGKGPRPCRPVRAFIPPAPVAPATLDDVLRWPGVPGLRGKTLQAALGTMLDVRYTAYSSGARVGLRGGTLTIARRRARVDGRKVFVVTKARLSSIVYVPGVAVSGTIDVPGGTGSITITGSASRGVLRISARRVEGTLDGEPVSVPYRPLLLGVANRR